MWNIFSLPVGVAKANEFETILSSQHTRMLMMTSEIKRIKYAAHKRPFFRILTFFLKRTFKIFSLHWNVDLLHESQRIFMKYAWVNNITLLGLPRDSYMGKVEKFWNVADKNYRLRLGGDLFYSSDGNPCVWAHSWKVVSGRTAKPWEDVVTNRFLSFTYRFRDDS